MYTMADSNCTNITYTARNPEIKIIKQQQQLNEYCTQQHYIFICEHQDTY